MITQFVITYKGPARLLVPGGKRILSQITRGAWYLLGVYWHQKLRPKHFTREGAIEYGYVPRTKRYNDAKRKQYGHADPLVWTGKSRQLAAIQDVRATSKGCRVVIHATGLNRRPGIHSRVIPREEMTRISTGESRELTGVLDKLLQRGIDEQSEKVTHVIQA